MKPVISPPIGSSADPALCGRRLPLVHAFTARHVLHRLKERDRKQEPGRASGSQSVSIATGNAGDPLPDPELAVEEAHKSTFVADEVTAPSNWKKSIVINGVGALAEPLATHEEGEQRVGPPAGIPMLGLDALASAAYGPEAAMTLLIPLFGRGLSSIHALAGRRQAPFSQYAYQRH